MSIPYRRVSISWLRLPRRTARLRLTAVCAGLFLLSGAALVAITYALFERATEYKTPPIPAVPPAPKLSHAAALGSFPSSAASGFAGSTVVQGPSANPLPHEIYEIQAKADALLGPFARLFTVSDRRLVTQEEQQLTRDQHALSNSVHQLAKSVHELSQAGTVQAAQRAADSHQLLVNSGIALAIVAVLALLAGWLVAGRMLRPVRTITGKARRISSASLHERLALDGPDDELKELGDTLDDLFARLEAAFEAQRHFVANASHELRTPLTAERTLLQVALDDPYTTTAAWRSTAREVLASSDEQASLIEALLTLASSEGGLAEREPVDLAATVAATSADLQPEIDRLGIHVDQVTEPASLDGDPLLVERLVANLITNAVRHNIAGGRVEVRTEVRERNAVLSVTNTGPLVPAADLDRLFQPFQRLDRGRANHKDGHGLGLSIVRAIAIAHGAAITAEPEVSGGLCIEVFFPRPASPHGVAAGSHGSGRPRDERSKRVMRLLAPTKS